MNEERFIELALRYLDGVASQTEVEQLGAAMLEHAERRAIYRDLVQQAQLAHEWESTKPAQPTQTVRRLARRRWALPVAVAAAAAAMLITSLLLLRVFSPPEPEPAIGSVAEPKAPDFFGDQAPTWAEIYRSPFDYPEFVWNTEFATSSAGSETVDEFADSEIPTPIPDTPAREFSRLLAPIAMFPSGESFGSRLY